MKKVLLAGVLSLVVLTGCGKKETITCTQTQTTMGVTLDAVVKVDLEGNRFKGIDMTIDSILPEKYLDQKDTFVKSFEKQYASFESKYGVKPVVSESDEGVKVTASMSAEQAKKFSGSNDDKATRKDVIDTFGKQGYTCK